MISRSKCLRCGSGAAIQHYHTKKRRRQDRELVTAGLVRTKCIRCIYVFGVFGVYIHIIFGRETNK